MAKVDAIIEKYRPPFIPEKAPAYSSDLQPVIRYEILLYRNLDEMLKAVPHGGHSVHYPRYEDDGGARNHYSFSEGADIISNSGMEYNGIFQQWKIGSSWYYNEIDPANYVFVITFVCNYPFSSKLVKMLFNGGVNTVKAENISGYNGVAKGERGTMYLLWTRGAGIINAK